MKIAVTVSQEQGFDVGMWWAKSPEFVIKTLTEQLEAAQAVWPELKEYKIEKRRKR